MVQILPRDRGIVKGRLSGAAGAVRDPPGAPSTPRAPLPLSPPGRGQGGEGAG
jgi:hypothetical protein